MFYMVVKRTDISCPTPYSLIAPKKSNLLQMEFGVLPTKVLKEDKATYILALIDTREKEDITIFQNCMASLHIPVKNAVNPIL